MNNEITRVEDLEPYLGKVVKVWWVPEHGWLFHILGDRFEQLDGPDPASYGVRSTVQVHDGVHGNLGLNRNRFNRGMKAMPCDPSEYADVEFSYGETPPK